MSGGAAIREAKTPRLPSSQSPACADCPVRDMCAWNRARSELVAGTAEVPDPAAPPTRPPAPRFTDTDRYHPGRLLDALGIAYIKVGDFPRAIAVHRQLERLCPDNREMARRLAGLFLKEGDTESARRCLAKRCRPPAPVLQKSLTAKKVLVAPHLRR